MDAQEIKEAIRLHELWIKGDEAGVKANLTKANLRYADLENTNLRYANLEGANLRYTNLSKANLEGADLEGANLEGADLRYTNLSYSDLRYTNLSHSDLENANLSHSDLENANLSNANLLAFGNMRELRTMQIDTWQIGYTHDTLQVGCQRHTIEKWRRWDTPAGRKWVSSMDSRAEEWAVRNLALLLALIDANPASGITTEGIMPSPSDTPPA